MPKLKLAAAAALAIPLGSLLAAPAAVADPWRAPWVIGHVVGAAARLATLPLIAVSAAASAVADAAPPEASGHYAPPPGPYVSGGYYGPPGYYPPPPAYYPPPPAYYAAPVGYYGGPQRYYPTSAYRMPTPHLGGGPVPEAFNRYYAAGMRYSGSHGGQGFSPSRGFAHHRW